MVKNNFEGNKNFTNESEVESKVVTVGSNQSHKALMMFIVVVLVCVVGYFYFSPSSKEIPEVINKKEEVKQNIQELKDKLERVPDGIPIPERIVSNPLPSLPPIIEPQNIPEIKPEIKPEVKPVNKEQEKPKETVSNIPSLPKPGGSSDGMINNFPTSFPTITHSGYPRDRRGAQMLAISGDVSSGSKTVDNITLSSTSAQQNKATKVGRLDLMITQGKIIDAILETAISSDIQGPIRAMVSRDVYAEAGDTVLVPKGSKLIGSYSFDSNISKARVNITWNRVILPHGIDIAISSQGTDALGRAGITGIVDNKIINSLVSSVLLAGVSIGAAVVGQKASYLVEKLTTIDMVRSIATNVIDLSPLKGIITGNEDDAQKDKWKLNLGAINKLKNAVNDESLVNIFRSVVSGLGFSGTENITVDNIRQLLRQQGSKSSYESAIEKSITDFSKDMRDIVERSIDKKPTVYVDQGTALKVFVNHDIIFPPQAISYQ